MKTTKQIVLTEEQQAQLRRMMSGQIWEECEVCGEEPVYLPTMRCETCLRKRVVGTQPKK